VPDTEVEDLLRRLAPQVLGAVVRRYGHFDTAEDAAQEALLAAAMHWAEGWHPGQSSRLADNGRLAQADRPAAQRAGSPTP
jgi:predicted RNA polymerase sigma factor